MLMNSLICFSFQSGGEIIERDGKKRKLFYGMASATAMKKHAGGVAEYRASEGKTVEVFQVLIAPLLVQQQELA